MKKKELKSDKKKQLKKCRNPKNAATLYAQVNTTFQNHFVNLT